LLLPAWPSLSMCHLFGIRSLVTWLELKRRYHPVSFISMPPRAKQTSST
jgi:hypothetical protein